MGLFLEFDDCNFSFIISTQNLYQLLRKNLEKSYKDIKSAMNVL